MLKIFQLQVVSMLTYTAGALVKDQNNQSY